MWNSKFFSIFFKFVSATVSHKPTNRIQFSNAYFFSFFMKIMCIKKNLNFWPFRSILCQFSDFYFLKIFVFKILKDNKNLNYNMHLKGNIKTFNLRCHCTLYDQLHPRHTRLKFCKKLRVKQMEARFI